VTRSVPLGEVRLFGDRAFLIGVADAESGRALARAVHAAAADAGAIETVCSFATVMVVLRDPAARLGVVRSAIEDALTRVGAGPGADSGGRPGRSITLSCTFDGPDFMDVAARVGAGAEDVVQRLTGCDLTVVVVGFSPGFAYLHGLPPELEQIPRRAEPRPEVPAGAVALANGYAAVYPTASPGGWQLIGRTGVPLFSTVGPPYAALAPGDRVRLTVAAPGQSTVPEPLALPVWAPPPGARVVFEVEVPGLRTVVQDEGRRGVAAIGVPAAGPADPVSHALANRLAGNPVASGALEITAGGVRLRCLGTCHVAVVGGSPEVRVDDRVVAEGRLLALDEGQVLRVGPARNGFRSYLSVAGGFVGPSVFGSTASDELCGLGPGPLAPGQRLHAGPWSPPLGDHLGNGILSEAGNGSPVVLRVLAGPHPERFVPDALARLADARFIVEDRSNRVGLRLHGSSQQHSGGPALPPLRASGSVPDELDSQGVVTGAVQVPPGGAPVVLLPDHATLGGYPVVAVVASVDHGLLGQCAPGTEVRLAPVDVVESIEAADAARRVLERAVTGHYPLAVG
jgi:KipI family sensor histidine kinase inhibitor